jgi:beta-lactamase regulating signal transducer with metallopeptidase domain
VEGYQFAWTVYAIGAVGCAVAAWLLFRRFGREWAHFFFVSVLALLLTPYAIDSENMTMAPALFFIVIEGITEGMDAVMPVVMVVLGVWLAGLVISLLLQLAARRFSRKSPTPDHRPVIQNDHEMSDEEYDAHDELSKDHIPLRAER